MRKIDTKRWIAAAFATLSLAGALHAETPAGASVSVVFNPPEGWRFANRESLPPVIKTMVIGEGSRNLPPSICLGIEPFDGTVQEYIRQVVKPANKKHGIEWRDLGKIKTEAGNALLTQLDMQTEWGEIREMQVFLVKEGNAYILTSAALKEEFPKFYKQFFNSMRSLRFNSDLIGMIPSTERRAKLESATTELLAGWNRLAEEKQTARVGAVDSDADKKALFEDEEFQTKYWAPFKGLVTQDFEDLGSDWQEQLLNKTLTEQLKLR